MSGVANVTIQPSIPNVVNFKAGENEINPYRPQRQAPVITRPPMDDQVLLQRMMQEQQKAKKDAKKQKALNYTFQGLLVGLLALTAVLQMKSMGIFKKKFNIEFKNLSKELSLEEMALPDTQKKAAERIDNIIKNRKEVFQMGGGEGSAILFYGPPGTGKNTFAYAITKKYPNAKFVEMDISKMNSKWFGESEQNVLGTMEAILKEADKNPNENYFVFIDEIDSVMMQDNSSSSKLSNDILNAFKKGFNALTNKSNVIVMGATNLRINPEEARLAGKVLDGPMLDRFGEKILVDLPTKEQLKLAITNYYKNPELSKVDDSLKDIDSEKLDKITELLAKRVSFRTLVKGILQPAARGKKVTPDVKISIDDLIETIKNKKDTLNIPDAELKKFLNSVNA